MINKKISHGAVSSPVILNLFSGDGMKQVFEWMQMLIGHFSVSKRFHSERILEINDNFHFRYKLK